MTQAPSDYMRVALAAAGANPEQLPVLAAAARTVMRAEVEKARREAFEEAARVARTAQPSPQTRLSFSGARTRISRLILARRHK